MVKYKSIAMCSSIRVLCREKDLSARKKAHCGYEAFNRCI